MCLLQVVCQSHTFTIRYSTVLVVLMKNEVILLLHVQYQYIQYSTVEAHAEKNIYSVIKYRLIVVIFNGCKKFVHTTV